MHTAYKAAPQTLKVQQQLVDALYKTQCFEPHTTACTWQQAAHISHADFVAPQRA